MGGHKGKPGVEKYRREHVAGGMDTEGEPITVFIEADV